MPDEEIIFNVQCFVNDNPPPRKRHFAKYRVAISEHLRTEAKQSAATAKDVAESGAFSEFLK
jgi:hypothetical protein